MHKVIGVALLALASSFARADVLSSATDGFELQQSFAVHAPPQTVWKHLLQINKWWDPAHTWSGKSANLVLQARAGGCFCERLPGRGSVQHMQVVFVDAPTKMRLIGALGPLQEQAISGTLTWSLLMGKDGTQVTLVYRVHGYMDNGIQTWAGPVDEVLGTQMQRLKSYIELQSPDAHFKAPAAQ